ncbi:probable serine racemase [Homarus americanus]|uniref:probable serine racemase n=1 Tax=Homarus americanus TaxID=6706 RepID=UPI001C485F32|nr:probable serine racemase [Homarus americanus]
MSSPVELEDVLSASRRIHGWVHRTPVLTCHSLNTLAGRQLYFKAENLQKTGSFKVRGACNSVFLEKENNPDSAGVVTHSSGNHAQAVAYAASKLS